jgi:hypothetical protein
LGRGIVTVEPEHLEAAVRRVLDLAPELTVALSALGPGVWVWRAEREGTVVAVPGRTYLRAREATYGADLFRRALALYGPFPTALAGLPVGPDVRGNGS